MDDLDGAEEGQREEWGYRGLLGSWIEGCLVVGRGVEYLELSKLK